MRHSEGEGDEFARKVVVQGSAYITKVGARVGLDPAMVSNVIVTNDCLPVRQRLAGVLSRFGRYRMSSADGVGGVAPL